MLLKPTKGQAIYHVLKNYSWQLLKVEGWLHSQGDCGDRHSDHCPYGERDGLNSQYSLGEWELIAKEEDGKL